MKIKILENLSRFTSWLQFLNANQFLIQSKFCNTTKLGAMIKFVVFYAVAIIMTYMAENIWLANSEIPLDLTKPPKQNKSETILNNLANMFQKIVNFGSNFMVSIILWIFLFEVWYIIRFFGFKSSNEEENRHPEISKVIRPRILSR